MNRQKIRYLCLALLGLMGHMRGHMIGHTLMAQTASFSVRIDLNALPTGARVESAAAGLITKLSKVAGSLHLDVDTESGTMWTVSTDQPFWVQTLDAADDGAIDGGTGAATVKVAYIENTGGARSAILSFATTGDSPRRKRYTLRQEGSGNPLRVSIRATQAQQARDTQLENPTRITIDKAGEARYGRFDVDVVAMGAWEACPSPPARGFDDWLTLDTEPRGGCIRTSGTKRIRVTCHASTTTDTRMTTLIVRPDTDAPNPAQAFPVRLVITQKGADPVFSIDESPVSVSSRAGSFTLLLETTVPWRASTDKPSWIGVVDSSDDDESLTGPIQRYGGRCVRIRYGENTSGNMRSARVAFLTSSMRVSTRRFFVRITQSGEALPAPPDPPTDPCGSSMVAGVSTAVSNGLQVYPNPVARTVSIAVDEQAQMRLRSTEGTLLHTYPLHAGQNHIDLRAYTARGGVYFIEVETARERVVRRLVLR